MRRIGSVLLMTIATTAILLALAGPALAFTDVPITHKYREAIDLLSSRQIINGYDDGTFRPNNPITRQQFAKMILLTLEVPVGSGASNPFTDLDPTSSPTDPHYPNDYITTAWQNGITTGITPTTFGPSIQIKRMQVITMSMRAVESLRPGELEPAEVYEHDLYDEALESIGVHGPWALIARTNYLLDDDFDIVEWAFNESIGWTYDGDRYGSPFDPMPRAEVAQLLANVIDLVENPYR